jgi:hypothetical protein
LLNVPGAYVVPDVFVPRGGGDVVPKYTSYDVAPEAACQPIELLISIEVLPDAGVGFVGQEGGCGVVKCQIGQLVAAPQSLLATTFQ